uniref:Uncharacterized protein n=1 Tax=Bracon brevicornis TaxID=1563983 RepID=A0A6V7KEU7_9HYME
MDKQNEEYKSDIVGTFERKSDSMDDFEHVENMSQHKDDKNSSPEPSDVNNTFVQLIDVSRGPSNLYDRETPNLGKNLLDATLLDDNKEDILKPVPATPPPSADFEKFSDTQMSNDPFSTDLQSQLDDAKKITSAFMECERAVLHLGHDFKSSKPMKVQTEVKTDDNEYQDRDSPNDFHGNRTSDDESEAKSTIEKEKVFPKDDFLGDIKESKLPAPEKAPIMDFLGGEKVDYDWSKVGSAPTKPLPPVPKDGGLSGNETGDSEFESEPEPSPAKIAPAAKPKVSAPVPVSSRIVEEKKLRQHIEEIAPRKIFADMGIGKFY